MGLATSYYTGWSQTEHSSGKLHLLDKLDMIKLPGSSATTIYTLRRRESWYSASNPQLEEKISVIYDKLGGKGHRAANSDWTKYLTNMSSMNLGSRVSTCAS